ncbi:archaetidylserine decarboxylase [Salinibius halmophilus]|uniref:archaetidylserine decarboxylase n=1 Tax=Salinibius halmophilus TaxID=1853216 RepID=UPI000E668CBF|nr:archaetidylserine decarboxylase [Salinibius halmophilus]
MSPFVLLQHITPQHLLTRIIGSLAASRTSWIKQPLINWFSKTYKVNMAEALEPNLEAYDCFNDFFTRALAPEARPFSPNPHAWLSPADGEISQAGKLTGDRILQAKGMHYTATQLLGNSNWAQEVRGGDFCTIYLSPSDYHRIHMPCDGKLTDTSYIPGKLFSVNQKTAQGVDALFARNERLVCRFEGEQGPFYMVYVGALIVAGIETPWGGREVLTRAPRNRGHDHKLKQGEESGRFLLGSTVILLTPKDVASFENCQPGTKVQVHVPLNYRKDDI